MKGKMKGKMCIRFTGELKDLFLLKCLRVKSVKSVNVENGIEYFYYESFYKNGIKIKNYLDGDIILETTKKIEANKDVFQPIIESVEKRKQKMKKTIKVLRYKELN